MLEADNKIMVGRLVAITILGIVLICAAAIGSWLLLYDRGNIGGKARTQSAMVVPAFAFEGRTSRLRASGRVSDASDGTVAITLDLRESDGSSPASGLSPLAFLEMPSHNMTLPAVLLSEQQPGTFVGEAVVNMRGRWRIRIDLPDGAVRATFDVGS